MWVRKEGRVGRSGRFVLVCSGRLLIQHHQSVTKVGIELLGQLKKLKITSLEKTPTSHIGLYKKLFFF